MRKLFMVVTLVALVAFGFGMAGPAQALSVTYFGEDSGLGENTPLSSWANAAQAEADFLANLVGVGTENFESFADGTAAPLLLTFPGAGTVTLQGDGEVNEVPSGNTNGKGRYATSGTHYWETGANFNFSIFFSNPVAAFGFYGIDAGDFQGQLTLDLVSGGTQTLNIPHTVSAPGGSVIYLGVIENDPTLQFTSVSFGNIGSSVDNFGFDDMTIGSLEQVQPVPEPSTILLVGTGLIGIIGFGRKRLNKKA